MGKWEMVAFDDVLTIINGKNQRQVENPSGRYPIYGSGGIMGYADDHLCEANTVVIGRKGTINKPIFVQEPFWNVDTAFGLSANTTVLYPKYLFYFCVQFDFETLNTTVTIPSLTKSNLLKIRIPLPPLPVQRQIADVLDRASTLIEKRKAQIDKLDLLVKSQFIEMFGDPVTNPKGWETKRLGDLSILITKGASPNWQGYSYTDDPSQTLFITSENVREGYLDMSKIKYIEDGFNEKQKRSLLHRGDFLINIVGASIGRAAQYNLSQKANINQAVALVRLKKNLINDKYLLLYLNLPKALMMYEKMQVSVARSNLSLQNISDLEILLPSITLQNGFAEFVQQVELHKTMLRQSLDKLELNYKSLMQKCFRGEVF